ncbi:MAG: glycosyltransferase involved in cell wall biosynthesis [Gammaproteobacteria bacterium]|jgi:glycosyltransferase involved in cell wall biosynthesis
MTKNISIILPAKNESASLVGLLQILKQEMPEAEIIVVNDGSTDNTEQVCSEAGVRVVSHPYSMGNGASIKSGARVAKGDVFVFMDADGQHRPEDIKPLLNMLKDEYVMVVGERSKVSQASLVRSLGNSFYNKFASWVTGQRIGDLTSGFRAVRAKKFKEFLYLLPNGFSYPTTITMAFFRAGYAVGYLPIIADQRIGKSHIDPLRDGLRFLLIIFKIGTLYSPLKIFIPFALLHFMTGLSYYAYTFIALHRFTNMSAVLFIASVTIFLMGLISEQITMLIYQKKDQ